jgi:hypothetical protein
LYAYVCRYEREEIRPEKSIYDIKEKRWTREQEWVKWAKSKLVDE